MIYARISICMILQVCFISGIRVCPTLSDYNWWFNSNPKCYYNPSFDKNITEVAQSWGLTAEEHYVTTKDGYQLLVERIYFKASKSTPVIIGHGVATNGQWWLIKEEESLAYLLAFQGYDVWLLNFRGSLYSKRHVKLNSTDQEFWKYSITEMGIHDIRTSLAHVHQVTGKQAIYIGYSVGTTSFFIYSSTFSEEAKNYLKGMIALAPSINFKGIKSYITLVVPIWSAIKSVVYYLWNGEIPVGFSESLWPLIQSSLGIEFVQTVFNYLVGDNDEQLNPVSFPSFVAKLDTMGVEVFTHYVQIYQAGVFQNYDYGEKENLRIYGTSFPPAFDLSKITVPITLFVGLNDWLAPPENAEQLYSELTPSSRCGYHVIPLQKWNHNDFFMAKDVEKYLYADVLNKIKIIDLEKCSSLMLN